MSYINSLCNTHDILVLQETWLASDELHALKTLHPLFDGKGITAMDSESGIMMGRPFGGLGIMWRKSISVSCKTICYNDPRIMGLELITNKGKILLINVYLPYQSYDNTEEYMYYLGKLHAVIDEADTPHIMLLGDFNADVCTNFETELIAKCNQLNMTISDYAAFGRDSGCFTYVSHSTSTTSWLDHIICSHDMSLSICKLVVLDKSPVSDHLALSACLKDVCISANPTVGNKSGQVICKPVINWGKASPAAILSYQVCTKEKLSQIALPSSALTCTNPKCTDVNHLSGIDALYNDICNALQLAGVHCLQTCSTNNIKNFIIPGWNDYVELAHKEARHHYIIWRSQGKPRAGAACVLMRQTRLKFKYALRQCVASEEMARADSMAKKLAEHDTVAFWKEIRKIYNKKVPLATSIAGVSGEQGISEMWKTHYSDLLNCVTSNQHQNHCSKQVR